MYVNLQLVVWDRDSVCVKFFLDPLVQSPLRCPVRFCRYPDTKSHDDRTLSQFIYKNHHLCIVALGVRVCLQDILKNFFCFADVGFVGDSYFDLKLIISI